MTIEIGLEGWCYFSSAIRRCYSNFIWHVSLPVRSLLIITCKWFVFPFIIFHHLWCSIASLWHFILFVDLFLNYPTSALRSVFNLSIHSFLNSGKFSSIISSNTAFPSFYGFSPGTVVEISWNISFFASQLSHLIPLSDCVLVSVISLCLSIILSIFLWYCPTQLLTHPSF